MTASDRASGPEPIRSRVAAQPGRSVEVLVTGPADGLPLVYHTGTPSGLAVFEPMVRACAERGLRLILYTRPGYGGSDPQPGRRIAEAAADVRAILDHLGAGEFVTAGASGGGPHALACAALLPGRCLAAATLGGVAPREEPGWLTGMAEENVVEFGAAIEGDEALTAFLCGAAAELAGVTGDQVAQALGQLASAADRRVLTGEYADHLAASFRAAVSTGIAGWRDDDLAFVADWGVTLDTIDVPVSIWQGDADNMVPLEHGRRLALLIPHARPHLLAGEGHLTIGVHRFGDVLDELIELAGRA
jgi:pimeloyl-ACP methyl ester carboxylesterase